MSVQIKTVDYRPKRQSFGHIARRLGADKPASRYQEGVLDLQPTENFHCKPLWEPEYWTYDARKTAATMEDWYKPLDPRQYYYASYNIARANMQQAIDRNFAFVEERGLLIKASDEARARIEILLLPLRHLHWGANMNMTEICQRGYGAAITAPCIFSAGDHLGMAQILSRLGLVLDGQTGASLDRAKQAWLEDDAWQGVRAAIEHSFVERDWLKLFVEQTLGFNLIFDLVYRHAELAWRDAGLTVAMLTEFMSDWRVDESKWSDSVVKVIAAESAHNQGLISQWAREAIDRAEQAGAALSLALVGDASAASTAAGAARVKAAALGLTL